MKLGLGRLGFHHYCSDSPEVAAWGRGGKGAQRGTEQDGGGGEKYIFDPQIVISAGQLVALAFLSRRPSFAWKLFCIKFSQPQNYLSSPPAKLAFFHQTLGSCTNEI